MIGTVLENGTRFVYANARLLERLKFEYRLNGAPAEPIIQALRAYQLPDGGFGHALEPDLRAPDNQPLFTSFALGVLYGCGLRAPDLALHACDDISARSDLSNGIHFIYPSSQRWPRASHWQHTTNLEPRPDVLIGFVGLLNWQGISHPWLERAVPRCLALLETTPLDDAHALGPIFTFLESLPQNAQTQRLYSRAAEALPVAGWYLADAPTTGYGLTPLDFATRPDSYCRRLFTQAQLDGHLDELLAGQQEDGGWPIRWEPPAGAAASEWRAYKTVSALATLRAYGRI